MRRSAIIFLVATAIVLLSFLGFIAWVVIGMGGPWWLVVIIASPSLLLVRSVRLALSTYRRPRNDVSGWVQVPTDPMTLRDYFVNNAFERRCRNAQKYFPDSPMSIFTGLFDPPEHLRPPGEIPVRDRSGRNIVVALSTNRIGLFQTNISGVVLRYCICKTDDIAHFEVENPSGRIFQRPRILLHLKSGKAFVIRLWDPLLNRKLMKARADFIAHALAFSRAIPPDDSPPKKGAEDHTISRPFSIER